MPRFTEIVVEHFQDPRHRGPLNEPTHVGTIGVPGAGPFFVLQLRVRDQVVEAAAFECNACGATIACGSLLTDWLIQRPVGETQTLSMELLLELAGGLPSDKRHCAAQAVKAFQLALASPILDP